MREKSCSGRITSSVFIFLLSQERTELSFPSKNGFSRFFPLAQSSYRRESVVPERSPGLNTPHASGAALGRMLLCLLGLMNLVLILKQTPPGVFLPVAMGRNVCLQDVPFLRAGKCFGVLQRRERAQDGFAHLSSQRLLLAALSQP